MEHMRERREAERDRGKDCGLPLRAAKMPFGGRNWLRYCRSVGVEKRRRAWAVELAGAAHA